jgi:hypothetical protein
MCLPWHRNRSCRRRSCSAFENASETYQQRLAAPHDSVDERSCGERRCRPAPNSVVCRALQVSFAVLPSCRDGALVVAPAPTRPLRPPGTSGVPGSTLARPKALKGIARLALQHHCINYRTDGCQTSGLRGICNTGRMATVSAAALVPRFCTSAPWLGRCPVRIRRFGIVSTRCLFSFMTCAMW